jgi:RHS repeat-associated protein
VDAGTGLTSIGARWYDPATGAFASLDPVLDKASPQQLNGYTYSGADPVSSSDPTGENQIGCNGPCPPPPRKHGKPLSRGTFDTGPGGGGGGTASTSHGASNNSGLGNPPTCGDPMLSGSIFCYNMAANTTNGHSATGVWRWWAGTCASVPVGLPIAFGCTGGSLNPASGSDNGGTDEGGNGSGNSQSGNFPDVPRTSADRFKDILAWLAGRADDTTQSITFDPSGKVVRSSLDGPRPTSADVGNPQDCRTKLHTRNPG